MTLWGGAEQSIAFLADRTLASEDDVCGTLQHTEHQLVMVASVAVSALSRD